MILVIPEILNNVKTHSCECVFDLRDLHRSRPVVREDGRRRAQEPDLPSESHLPLSVFLRYIDVLNVQPF